MVEYSSPSLAAPGDAVGHLRRIVPLVSTHPPGESGAIMDYCRRVLVRAGYEVQWVEPEPGRANVVGTLGTGGPTLAFNAHNDTVVPGDPGAWETDPFDPVERSGRLYGLGSANCKGSAAAQLAVAERIAAAGGPTTGRVQFTFVTDEENLGPLGMRYLREHGIVRPDWLVLGAPSENKPVVAERGVFWADISVPGKASHAGEPHHGRNAIVAAAILVAGLQARYDQALAARVDGGMHSTVNIGVIRGGESPNVVPNLCRIEVDRRLLPPPLETTETAYEELQQFVRDVSPPGVEPTVVFKTGTNGFRLPETDPLAVETKAAAEAVLTVPVRFGEAIGVSDGRYYANDGIGIVNIGPGEGEQGHSPNESVPLSQIEEAVEIYAILAQKLVGVKADND